MHMYENDFVGRYVKHKNTGAISVVTKQAGIWLMLQGDGLWVHKEMVDLVPINAQPGAISTDIKATAKDPVDRATEIRDAFVVDKTLFYTRREAENHVAKIKIHRKLEPVFGGVLNAQQEAILETLVEKLIHDREEFAELLKV